MTWQSVHDVWLSRYSAAGEMENQAELEEKTRLINQVLELQHTLEGKKDTHFNLSTKSNSPIQLSIYSIKYKHCGI